MGNKLQYILKANTQNIIFNTLSIVTNPPFVIVLSAISYATLFKFVNNSYTHAPRSLRFYKPEGPRL